MRRCTRHQYQQVTRCRCRVPKVRRHHRATVEFRSEAAPRRLRRSRRDLGTLARSHTGDDPRILAARTTDANRRAWTEAAKRLVPRYNIVCKISAVAGASDPDWTVESIRPWILGCIEMFGATVACWAPTGRSIDYSAPTSMSSPRTGNIVSELSDREQDDLLFGTAQRVYNINRSRPRSRRLRPATSQVIAGSTLVSELSLRSIARSSVPR